MTARRRRPTRAMLVAESRHVLYDIQMFGHTIGLIDKTTWHDSEPEPGLPSSRKFDENIKTLALIESHLTHARSLIRFMWPTATARPSDMRAADFVRKYRTVPELWPDLAADLDAIDKEIAHLTYLRPPEPTQWDINNKLTPRLIGFIWSVAEDRVQEMFTMRALAALMDVTSFTQALLSHQLITGRISTPVATQGLQPQSGSPS